MNAQVERTLYGRVGDPLTQTWLLNDTGGNALSVTAARFEVYGPDDDDPVLVLTDADAPLTLNGNTVVLDAAWADLVDVGGDPLQATTRYFPYRYRLQVALPGRPLDTLSVGGLELVEPASEPQQSEEDDAITVDLGTTTVAVSIAPSTFLGFQTDNSLSGDGTTGAPLGIAAGGVTNTHLANASVTIGAGAGLSGGGAVALGGSITINFAADLNDVGDVSAPSPGDGHGIYFNSASGQWEAGAPPNAGGGLAENSVGDFELAYPLSAFDADGGTIDGTTVGQTTPAAGAFTTLAADTLDLGSYRLQDKAFQSVTRLEIEATGANSDMEMLLAPTGTATHVRQQIINSPNVTNYAGLSLEVNNTRTYLSSTAEGTGTILPLEIRVDGPAAIRFFTDSTERGSISATGAATLQALEDTPIGQTTTAAGGFTTLTASTLDTGQGANELYPMDQGVRTTDNVQFAKVGVGMAPVQPLDVSGNAQFAGDLLPSVGYAYDIGSVQKKWLTLHAAELRVSTLVAADELVTMGGRQIVGTSTVLINDVQPGDTTIDVRHNNFSSGDWVRLEAGGQFEEMQITSAATAITGGYEYSVTRNADGTGANAWLAGDTVWNRGGQAGYGFIDQYAIESHVTGTTTNGPATAYFVRTGTGRNDVAPRALLGNLNGWYGFSADTFGLAVGNATASNFVATADTVGLRNSTSYVIRLDSGGNAFVESSLTLGASGYLRDANGQLRVGDLNGAFNVSTTTIGFGLVDSEGGYLRATPGEGLGFYMPPFDVGAGDAIPTSGEIGFHIVDSGGTESQVSALYAAWDLATAGDDFSLGSGTALVARDGALGIKSLAEIHIDAAFGTTFFSDVPAGNSFEETAVYAQGGLTIGKPNSLAAADYYPLKIEARSGTEMQILEYHESGDETAQAAIEVLAKGFGTRYIRLYATQ